MALSPIEERNRKIYAKPPSQEQVDAYIKKLGVSELHFERFFELPTGTIKVMRARRLNMPLKYWHIFYMAKDYIRKDEYLKDFYRLLNPRSRKVTKMVASVVKNENPNDSRIGVLQ